MSIIRFPKQFCENICSRIARFWWANNGKERGIHWKKWNFLTKSKRLGGMGFKDFYLMNLALLAKQAWRLLQNPNALWAQIMKAKYYPNHSILEVPRRKGVSWVWASIMQGRDFLKSNGRWVVGNGQSIRIWEDRWIPSYDLMPNNAQNTEERVYSLIDQNNNSWNLSKIREVLPEQAAIQAIQVPISYLGSSDRFIWPHSKDGKYSVKTGYHIAYSNNQNQLSLPSSSTSNNPSFWNLVWSIKTPQKVKQFIWRLCNNAIPVRVNLFRRKLVTSPLCPICSQEPETVEHAMLLCPWTQLVWFGSQLQFNPSISNLTCISQWLQQKFMLVSETKTFKDYGLALMANLLWEIWKGRNKFTFQHLGLSPHLTIHQARVLTNEFLSLEMRRGRAFPSQTVKQARKTWRPPPENRVKCNVDAAFSSNKNIASLAAVMRDHKGNLVTGLVRKVPCSSSGLAEALALREGLLLARNCLCENPIIESDNFQLVEASRSGVLLCDAAMVIDDIIKLKNSFSACALVWAPRESNNIAHYVAKAALVGNLPRDWLVRRPFALEKLLILDCPQVNV